MKNINIFTKNNVHPLRYRNTPFKITIEPKKRLKSSIQKC